MVIKDIKAVGFDLFDTLITVKKTSRTEALQRMVEILQENGFSIDFEPFINAYVETVRKYMAEAEKDFVETHNRYWIGDTLKNFGYRISATDSRIAETIRQYFEEFTGRVELLPGTIEMLDTLHAKYRLGLLSNFTHAPAVRDVLKRLKLDRHFDSILISGELGYRKPHPKVFSRLVESLGVPEPQIAFVGDNIVHDIEGALAVGIQPIWTRYAELFKNGSPETGNEPKNDIADSGIPQIRHWEDLFDLIGIHR